VTTAKAPPFERFFEVGGRGDEPKSWFKLVICSQACKHAEALPSSPNSKIKDLIGPVRAKLHPPFNSYYQFALDVLNFLNSKRLVDQKFHFEFGGHPGGHYYLIRLLLWADMSKSQYCDFKSIETKSDVSNFLVKHFEQFVLEAIDKWSEECIYPNKVFACSNIDCFASHTPKTELSWNSFIDVIVPTKNVSLFDVKRCLDSIERQIVPGDRIYLIDDNDVAEPELEKLSEESEFIQLIIGDRNGVASARNKGLNSGSNSLVSFVDSDDYLLPGYFELQRNFHKNNSDVAATGTWLQAFGNTSTIYPQWDGINPIGLLMCLPPAGVLTWKRSVLLESNFDVSFGSGFEDFDLVARIIAKSYTIAVLDLPLYMYQRGHISLSQSWSPRQEQELRSKVNSNVNLLCRHKLAELFELVSLHGKKLLVSHPDLVFRTNFKDDKETKSLGLIVLARRSKHLRKLWRLLPEGVRYKVFGALTKE
jgi:glycosyltransferase involved in cell wall biosynthesis